MHIRWLLAWAALWAAWTPSPSLAAQAEKLVDGIPHAALFSVAFDGPVGFAVGAAGQILRSSDGGASWTVEPAPTRLALLGVAVRGEQAIAVGQMGVAAVREPSGTWTVVETGTPERLMAVALGDRGLVIAVGAFGALKRSLDGGRTWENAAPKWTGMFRDEAGRLGDFFEPSLYAVDIRGDEVLIGGELSLILRSEDRGQTFTAVHAGASTVEGASPTIFDLDVGADGQGLAVGQEGLVLATRDGGRSWSTRPPPTGVNLLGVVVGPQGRAVAAGMRQTLASVDGGRSWIPVQGVDLSSGWYSGVAWPPGSAHPVLAGNAGRILKIQGLL